MKLFRSKDHPGFWIGEDRHGALMIWPAEPRGWTKRTHYDGGKRQLEELSASDARGTGWPGGGTGRKPKRGEPAKGLTIRVTDTERREWERAAKSLDSGLSDWVRDTCNREARDPRPRVGSEAARPVSRQR